MENKASKQSLILCLLLLALVGVAFEGVRNNAFINFDDDVYITENMHVQSGLRSSTIAWAFRTTEAGNWHPLTWLSHCLDCQLFGLNPAGHHLAGMILHSANSLLLFLMLARFTGAVWRSFMVASFFALHPAHVESVAWAAERKDLLSTMFFMLTLLAWHGWTRTLKEQTFRRWSFYGLSILFYTCGLMSKPMLVTLPLVLMLLDFWPLRRFEWSVPKTKALLHEKMPFFILAAASCVITFQAQHHAGAVETLTRLPLGGRLLTAVMAILGYLAKLILPRGLSVFYPSPRDWGAAAVVAALILLVALSMIAWSTRRRWPVVMFGWLWFLVTLAPVVGIVQVGMQAMADRYTYIPFIGLFVLVVWMVSDLASHFRLGWITLTSLGGAVLITLAVLTTNQVRIWKDSGSLFSHALAVTHDNSIAHLHLGNFEMVQQGKLHEAIGHFRESVRLEPNLADAHAQLGSALFLTGERDQAIEELQKAVLLDPAQASARFNLGVALQAAGRSQEAIAQLREALRLRPSYAEALSGLGSTLAAAGKLEEAIPKFLEALHIRPDFAAAHGNLGLALAARGRREEAILHLRRARELQPENTQWQKSLEALGQ